MSCSALGAEAADCRLRADSTPGQCAHSRLCAPKQAYASPPGCAECADDRPGAPGGHRGPHLVVCGTRRPLRRRAWRAPQPRAPQRHGCAGNARAQAPARQVIGHSQQSWGRLVSASSSARRNGALGGAHVSGSTTLVSAALAGTWVSGIEEAYAAPWGCGLCTYKMRTVAAKLVMCSAHCAVVSDTAGAQGKRQCEYVRNLLYCGQVERVCSRGYWEGVPALRGHRG